MAWGMRGLGETAMHFIGQLGNIRWIVIQHWMPGYYITGRQAAVAYLIRHKPKMRSSCEQTDG